MQLWPETGIRQSVAVPTAVKGSAAVHQRQAGAMLKTTIAFTVQKGADAYNVLPQEAYVGANMRFILIREKRRAWRLSKRWLISTDWRLKCCMPMTLHRR